MEFYIAEITIANFGKQFTNLFWKKPCFFKQIYGELCRPYNFPIEMK